MWRRARGMTVAHELSVLEDRDVPFVWQHHTLFEPRGALVAGALEVPLVIAVEALQVAEARDWGVHRPMWGPHLEERGELRQLRRADLVTCVSSELAEMLAASGVHADRIMVTPNMADPARFRSADRAAVRASRGLTDRFVIGWVGSFRRFHALDVLLEAFELFARTNPSATLLLVGDGPERARCCEFATRFPSGQVLLPGPVPFDEVPDWISSFDVGVVPAQAGQTFHYSPLKLQEYQAAHVAVVVPDIGQMATTIQEGVNGLKYRPGDRQQLAQRLEELIRDPAQRLALADTGRATIDRAGLWHTRAASRDRKTTPVKCSTGRGRFCVIRSSLLPALS